METHRIKTKVGVHEFEADGPKDVVIAQFNAWLAAIQAMPATVTPADTANEQKANSSATSNSNAHAKSEVSEDVMERVFRRDDGLTLAALPGGERFEADALLALLYGYWKLESEAKVTGTAIMKSARQSGINFDRVDRVMGLNMPDYVLAAGVKKARRYQLNNRGIVKAVEIINGLVQ